MSNPLRILGIAGSLRRESYEASKKFIRQLLPALVDWTRRIS